MDDFEEMNKTTEVEDVEVDKTEANTEEYMDENEEKLPFAKAEVVRLMKENLDDDKMIRERVKVEMNKFLGDVLVNVCKQLNDYPYSTVEYEMLKESTYPYTNIERINEEKMGKNVIKEQTRRYDNKERDSRLENESIPERGSYSKKVIQY